MEYIYTRGASSDSRHIREKVFIEEQGFKEEFDEYDEWVDTLVIYENGCAVATGRLYECDEQKHIFKLGRIAVLCEYRHMHLGQKIIESMEERAKSLGASEYYISAQVRAVPFYEKCGYTTFGDTYLEEHVPHIGMSKKCAKH